MASKFLSGTATWTNSTRTVSAATMTPVYESADAGRQQTFRIGSSIFFGRIDTFVSTTSVTMLNVGTLPTSDGTIDDMTLFDLAEPHTYQDYLDEIASMIQDDAVKLTVTTNGDIDKLLAQAVKDYGRDKPYYIKKEITADGSEQYVLTTTIGSLWVKGYSDVLSVESPTGNKPPTMLEETDWIIYDDGTAQDESNKTLRFFVTPTSGNKFIVEFSTEYDLPTTGLQNFPDTDGNFHNISTLAAAYGCFRLATAYAQSTDATITADAVNYHDKSRKYPDLAKEYMKIYNLAVFGEAEPETARKPALADKDVDLETLMGGPGLFHGGANR